MGAGGGLEMETEIIVKKQWDQDVRKKKKKTWQRELKDESNEALKRKVKQDAVVLLKDGGNQTRGIKTVTFCKGYGRIDTMSLMGLPERWGNKIREK